MNGLTGKILSIATLTCASGLLASCSDTGTDTATAPSAAAQDTAQSVAASTIASASACSGAGDLNYVCGPANAEDIVQLADSKWLILSGMSGESNPGRLYLLNHETKTFAEWFPASNPRFAQDSNLFGACPGPLDPTNFSAHGLALREESPEQYRLYITSHGEREAIEVFDVDTLADSPTITWVGCVILPDRTSSNSVAILADGGFLTTKMIDPTAANGFAAVLSGEITGNVYEWHPGGTVTAVPGTELSGANGIELSDDQRYMYVAAIGSREILRFDRQATPIGKKSITIGIRPDNLRWTDDGMLLTIGGNFIPPEQCSNPPCSTGWSVIAIDPDTLEAERVTGADQTAALQGASTAIAVGEEIRIGTFRGDRVGYLPRP